MGKGHDDGGAADGGDMNGIYVVECGRVTHHDAIGTPSKELLHAAHLLVTSLGCPFGDCPHAGGVCPKPQMIHCLLVSLQRQAELPMCRVCGCTESSPCIEDDGISPLLGCHWVEPDLCSSCFGWENVTSSVSALADLEDAMGVNVAG